ncbi:uncharacterized protein BT62DRAFT_63483 [Guyanagaster necrorhizus]|uniref:Uncharacterized protein n=1 Tax=Guyanagaster necrorhizus TaxID=856835 RepID=A0A9P8AUQ0_9AGAR|nr:uncharacterized protein BT62DRAFT_63483 [Guyanagaster necrorhizus MCA 3950]KAG7447142.1 hypothetical protein BT62DRAFT_63483 [Guyanagaster necrorhizus MCA 3950]
MNNLTLVGLQGVHLHILPRRDAFFAAFSGCTNLTDIRLEDIRLSFRGLQTILTSVKLPACFRLSSMRLVDIEDRRELYYDEAQEPLLVDFQDSQCKLPQLQKDLDLGTKQLVLKLVSISKSIFMDMLTTSKCRILTLGTIKRLAILTATCDGLVWSRIQTFLETPQVRDSVSELHLSEDLLYNDNKRTRMNEEHLNIRLS